MKSQSDKVFDNAIAAQNLLVKAEQPLNFLPSVDWPDEARAKYLDDGTLPKITDEKINGSGSVDLITKARKIIAGEHIVLSWLRRIADGLEETARLIDTRATSEFFEASMALFGKPNDLLLDGKSRIIDLAHHMDKTLHRINADKLVIGKAKLKMGAESFARRLRPRLEKQFGDEAPRVKLFDAMSAKAAQIAPGRKRTARR